MFCLYHFPVKCIINKTYLRRTVLLNNQLKNKIRNSEKKISVKYGNKTIGLLLVW